MRFAAITSTFIMMSLTAGCLEEHERGTSDATTTRTADTTSASDTTIGDTRDGDTSVTCPDDCDDHDDCTADQCVDGVCRHYGVPGEADVASCSDNSECQSGDPCLVGTCVINSGCGAFQYGTCVYQPVPGCGSCEQGCDDGNACTTDSCGDGLCVHDVDADCVPQCTSDGLTPLAAVRDGGTREIKTLGVLAPYEPSLACDDGPTCGCMGGPGLGEGDLQLALFDGTDGGAASDAIALPSWQCETAGCSEVHATCRPLVVGATFRVWGTAFTNGPIPFGAGVPADPVAPPAPTDSITVSGYCLDTAPDSLTGDYLGRLTEGTVEITFPVYMKAVDQGVLVSMKGASCSGGASCPAWATNELAQDTVIEEGDGHIGFEFEAPVPTGKVHAHAKLFSREGSFVGRWAPTSNEPLGVETRLVLVRLGTGGPTATPQ